jgi:4-diphosphocytidyl-2-C-methyl-D-erythritol kinase
MRGAGEHIGERLALPPLPAVLVNPGVAVETGPVFKRLGLAPGARCDGGAHPAIGSGMEADAFLSALSRGHNDLEDAACLVAPVIVDVLAVLRAAKGSRIARMSGSGATCFALFSSRRAASRAAAAIKTYHPGWWVRPAMLR